MKQARPNKGPARGRLAFLARLAGIRAALERGEYLSEIYKAEKAHLPFSYAQFTRHVRRHLGAEADKAFGRGSAAPTEPVSPTPAARPPGPALPELPLAPGASKPGPIVAEGGGPKTFTHDPVPKNLDKLL